MRACRPRRPKSDAASPSFTTSSSAANKHDGIDLPRAWLPPTTPIPPGEDFEIIPDEYYPTTYSGATHWNAIPVFRPTWEQFQDFYTYCQRIRPQGMQSGIVKIVPPKEWLDIQPDLSERLEHIKIRRPLRQVVQSGGDGTYQQINQPQRDQWFTVREWAEMCASAEHRGPELKKIQDKLAEREELLTLQKCLPRRRSSKSQVQQDDGGHLPPSEASNIKPLAPHDDASATESSQLLMISPDTTPLPTPPASVGPASPHTEVDDPDAAEGTAASQDLPSATSTVEDTSFPRAKGPIEPQPPPETSSKEATCSAAASDTLLAIPAAALEESSPASTWDYKKAWVREYLPSKLADEATDEDWTIDVCSQIELEYWRSLGALGSTKSAVEKAAWYGADQSATLFDEDMRIWNVGKLDNVLTRMLGCIDEDGQWRNISLDSSGRQKHRLSPSKASGEDIKASKASVDSKGKDKNPDDASLPISQLDHSTASAITGVTTPYLYFGQWQATFSWHVEDMDLCSINYIHFGAPKQWYAIPQSERNRFETVMRTLFPTDARRCKQFLRHKSYLVNPARLASIKPLKLVQHAGEIVLTFPYGYHSGFNLGFNCAESTNFALDDWPRIGMEAQVCQCPDRENPVHIDVRKLYREAMAAQENGDEGEADDERCSTSMLTEIDDDSEAHREHSEAITKNKKMIAPSARASTSSAFKLKKRAPDYSSDDCGDGSDQDDSPSRKRGKTLKLAAAVKKTKEKSRTSEVERRPWTADELKTIQRARDMAPILTTKIEGKSIRKSINRLKCPKAHPPNPSGTHDVASGSILDSSAPTKEGTAPDMQSNTTHSILSFRSCTDLCGSELDGPKVSASVPCLNGLAREGRVGSEQEGLGLVGLKADLTCVFTSRISLFVLADL